PENIQNADMTIQGNRFRMGGGEENFDGTFTLGADGTPKTIDASFTVKDSGEKLTAHGIYELNGDTFRVCWREQGGERPREFGSKAGSGTRLIVLQRMQKEAGKK